MQQKTCTIETHVKDYECDYNQRMFLSVLMQHAQQMGSYHILQHGITLERMVQDGMTFVETKQRIRIRRMPVLGEELQIVTIPKQPKGVQFIRDTVFSTREGEELAYASISWALVDPQTHRVLRPSAFDIYGFSFMPNDGEEITSLKLKKPEGAGEFFTHEIGYSDLDYNRHVNNAVYADLVCNCVPAELMLSREVSAFDIIFRKEAAIGQQMRMERIQTGSTAFYVEGLADTNACFDAVIEFR